MLNVVSFYRFVDVPEPAAIQRNLQALCEKEALLGTVLLADEGFNGTLAGSADGIAAILQWLQDTLQLPTPVDARWTEADAAPFRKLRIRIKNEIVTLGRPDIRPQQRTGQHVSPREWNTLLDDPATLVIDTRNHYEIEVGTFPGALDPGTDSFRQFPEFVEQLDVNDRDRPVAMFCTGGIRCEKASALMQELGFSQVYQLQGGILNYLSTTADDDNRWDGECFVFDSRVAVDRDLAEGGYEQCHACRRPLSADDLQSADYREGVSCPQCINELESERELRLEERRRQVRLARERGGQHIGVPQQPKKNG
ncbi:oxygen-dependent tRNA uridine(34) hydroxylase TrhO [Woeseia oceani]|uniref:oxygen-dependent tRNA uridine(34) hydroxylase TrhO n=1 Tax=Woeseia oceani TaxID=1548547 RepID=UPI0009F49D21|nr:rhodanese-related sulfurtransferase [Woeseia oceani]